MMGDERWTHATMSPHEKTKTTCLYISMKKLRGDGNRHGCEKDLLSTLMRLTSNGGNMQQDWPLHNFLQIAPSNVQLALHLRLEIWQMHPNFAKIKQTLL